MGMNVDQFFAVDCVRTQHCCIPPKISESRGGSSRNTPGLARLAQASARSSPTLYGNAQNADPCGEFNVRSRTDDAEACWLQAISVCP
jgi:hypothetical protein